MNVIPTIISILIQTIENEEDNGADEGNDSDDDDKDENKVLQQSALLDFAMGLIKHGDDDYDDDIIIYSYIFYLICLSIDRMIIYL